MVFLQATPDAIISPRALILNDFLAFVQIATWRYETTNQGTRSRSRFRPARPLAPSSRAPAPSVALPQPRHFAAFRACRKSAWLDKGDRHQRPAQCLLRSPSASRTAISGVSYPNATAIPADSCPFTLNHRRAAYRAPVPWLSNFSSRDYASLRPARLPHMSAAGASVIAAGAIRGFALAHTLVHLYISDLHVNVFTSLPKSHPFRGQWSSRPR